MKKFLAGTAVCAIPIALLSVAAPAAAATSDGTLTVTVANDVNLNGTRDGLDAPLENVRVRIVDGSDAVVEVRTDASGVATFSPSEELTGGQYRVEVINPDAGRFTDAQILDEHTGTQYAPTVSFVDLSDGTDADLSVGFIDYTVLGPDNATAFSAVQPDSVFPNGETTGIYSIAYSLAPGTVTDLTDQGSIGAVYGIGVNTDTRDIYAGAYAKRGSVYGPSGPGAIYRVNDLTGAFETYATVDDAGTTAHDPDMGVTGNREQDYAFRTAVGRESLGDVEVNESNTFLTTVNLNTDSLVVFPIQEAAGPAPVQTLKVAPIAGCSDADWTPMALEESGDLLYVGATCGTTLDTYILTYQRSADGTLTATGDAPLHGNVDELPKRDGKRNVVFSLLGGVCGYVDWLPWNDTVPAECVEATTYRAPTDPANVGNQWTFPQPMLADIVHTEDGQLVLGFRDRGADQYGSPLFYGTSETTGDAYGNYLATGDIVATAVNGTELVFDEPYEFATTGAFHAEAASAGFVHVPGTGTILSNQMDATGAILTNGVRLFNLSNGAAVRNALVTEDFGKAQGLADMEAIVREATQQIGNRVWSDTDQDGIQDGNEPGIAGVQVSLYDENGELVATTETDENGEYYFDTADGLLPGMDYQVRLDREEDFAPGGPLSGYTPTVPDAGLDRGIDSNGTAADDESGLPAYVVLDDVTSPEAGKNDHSIDFGFVPSLVSVGDYVWLDSNGDGLQGDPAIERPLAGIEVVLYDADGREVDRTTTDANGYYAFTDLLAGHDYVIAFPTEVEIDGTVYPLTRQGGEGDDSAKDSNPGADGRVPFRAELEGENSAEPGLADNPTIDAGYRTPSVSVGDYVWSDSDRDGVQDEGEPGIEGVELTLTGPDGEPVTDIDGNVVGPVTTDENGEYSFNNLPVLPEGQHYTVSVKDPEGYKPTTPGQGDRDADSSTGSAESGDLTADGQRDDTLDFGFVPDVVSVGDFVWIDADGDGVQDEGEKPVAGATVTLLDADGKVVATTETDEDGYYVFADLTPSTDYTIVFPKTVTVEGIEYPLTKQGAGDDRAGDSNPAADGSFSFTTPATGENKTGHGEADDPTIDAGYRTPSVSVGDYVWFDNDGDGIQDKGEPGIEGVELTLTGPDGKPVTDIDGNVVGPVTTDENGEYSFDNLPVLPEGQHYTVSVKDPEGYKPTTPGQGDRDEDSSTGSAESGDLTKDGQRDSTLDFGYVPDVVSAGGFLWIDADGDGVQDKGEKPVAGETVTLLDADGNVVASTTTDKDGYYAFADLTPSTDYTIVFPKTVTIDGVEYPLTKQGAGDDANDSNPGSDGRFSFTSPETGGNETGHGQTDVTALDAGYKTPKVSVGDFVWIDQDGDGVQDKGEKPVAGATVTLLDADGKEVASTTTDEDGYYVFADLNPSTEYTIVFPKTVTVDGVEYPLTKQGAGADRADDSNPGADGRFTFTTPKAGANKTGHGEADDPTIDAGYKAPRVSVGDYVWFDEDGDGRQDDGEPGIPGVELELLGPDGKPVTDADGNPVKNVVTDENGAYSFDNLPALPPGEHYTVRVVAGPEGYEPTTPGAGDRAGDSSTGSAESGDLSTDGARDNTLDFGFVKPAPEPTATPEPTPTEEPSPEPTPEVCLEPAPGEPAPTPAPGEPEPTPAPEECPTPEVTPTPEITPAPSPTEKPDLSPTGGDLALPLGALGATLLIGGAVIFTMRRRAQQ